MNELTKKMQPDKLAALGAHWGPVIPKVKMKPVSVTECFSSTTLNGTGRNQSGSEWSFSRFSRCALQHERRMRKLRIRQRDWSHDVTELKPGRREMRAGEERG